MASAPKRHQVTCERCGASFLARHLNTRFCSRECRNHIPPGTLGAANELVVSVELMRRGYHVYRALSPAAPCDIIALRDGVCTRVEVKSATRLPDGSISTNVNHVPAERQDCIALVTPSGDILFIPDLDAP